MIAVDTNVLVRLLTGDAREQIVGQKVCSQPGRSAHGAAFFSFDQSFVRRARRAGAANVSGIPSEKR